MKSPLAILCLLSLSLANVRAADPLPTETPVPTPTRFVRYVSASVESLQINIELTPGEDCLIHLENKDSSFAPFVTAFPSDTIAASLIHQNSEIGLIEVVCKSGDKLEGIIVVQPKFKLKPVVLHITTAVK
jgi:hypothetical protein